MSTLNSSLSAVRLQFRLQNGFSLIEVLMVITILAVLTVTSLIPLGNTLDQSRFDETTNKMKIIRDAILGDTSITQRGRRTNFGFLGDIGAIPTAPQGINALLANPGLVSWTLDQSVRFGRGWNGPYVSSSTAGTNFGLDGWGRAIIYSPSASPPNITSYAADGVAGGTGFNTDIVVDLPVRLQKANVYGFISNKADPFLGAAVIEINYPDGTGALSTLSTTITAAAKGAFSFLNIPLGKRSVSVYIPSKAAPTTTIGPTLITIDNANYNIAYASFDVGGGFGGGPGCSDPNGSFKFVPGSLSLTSGGTRVNFSANILANMTISKISISNSRTANWSTFTSTSTKSNCTGSGGASIISPCPVPVDWSSGTIAPILNFTIGNAQAFKIDFDVSMIGAGTLYMDVGHSLGCEYIAIPGL